MYTILSIDGGGIRGYMAALMVAKLTQGHPSGLFDCIAGTSTGGIIACALGKPDDPPMAPFDIAELFKKRGSDIFDAPFSKKVDSLGGLADETYPVGPIRSILKSNLGGALLEEAQTEVIVPCYDLEARSPFVFVQSKAEHNTRLNQPLWEVALAGSMAPTYFPPHKLEDQPKTVLVDGGIYQNNPTMLAVSDALSKGYSTDEIFVVSLGTGTQMESISYQEAKDWGTLEWAKPAIDCALDGANDVVHQQASQLLSPGQYWRFQPRLKAASPHMDDASKENIKHLRKDVEDLAERRFDDIQTVKDTLAS